MPEGLTLLMERGGRALLLKLPKGEKDTTEVRHALREAFAAIDLPLPRQNDELKAAVTVMNMRGPRKRLLRAELERRDMVEYATF
jgi:hypothetical protein